MTARVVVVLKLSITTTITILNVFWVLWSQLRSQIVFRSLASSLCFYFLSALPYHSFHVGLYVKAANESAVSIREKTSTSNSHSQGF